VVGLAGPGDVEGCAMIDGAAVERQADSDVYRSVEGDELDGCVTLIVILGDHQIEFPMMGTGKHRVARQRADNVYAFGLCGYDGGCHLFVIFSSKHAAFTTMWVQSGNCDAGCLHPQPFEMIVSDADNFEHARGCATPDRIGQ